ncbi:MAG: ABC transporter ATP-binding protein [Saprospiraceae bacterium]
MKLELQSISKQYNRKSLAIDNLSIKIENGVFGLLAPNGAGKSTLLKIIATVVKPSKGTVILNKDNIIQNPNYMRKNLGFLPQDFGVYPNLTAIEFLRYMAALKGVGGSEVDKRINILLDNLNLSDVAKRPISTYSGGMKQRVGIAQALINDPKVIIFDEPTVGLDPEERVRFRNLISNLADDRIIILSSHIVSDIESIADTIAIMNKGRLIVTGKQDVITNKVSGKVYEKVIAKKELEKFQSMHLVIDINRVKDQLKIRYISHNRDPESIAKTARLEDSYLYLTSKSA